MGFGSTKTKHITASASYNLLEDQADALEQATAEALITGSDLVSEIVDVYVNGLTTDMRRFYNYGRDHYTNGLPDGAVHYDSASSSTIEAVLATIEGTSVSVWHTIVDSPLAWYWGMQFVAENRGWKESDKLVYSPPFAAQGNVYIRDIEHLGNGQIQITYVDQSSTTNSQGKHQKIVETLHTETFTATDWDLKEVYYHVSYHLVDGEGVPVSDLKFWIYKISDGTYPTLDRPASNQLTSPFYPVVPIRVDNTDMTRTEVQDTDLYQTSKTLLGKLGMDIDSVSAAVHDNPNIDDVDQVWFQVGANLQSENEAVQKYLFEFFSDLASRSTNSQADFIAWASGTQDKNPPAEQLVISDPDYMLKLSWYYISDTTYTGSIGSVGYVDRESTVTESESLGASLFGFLFDFNESSVTFRKQITATTYRELHIHGLVHENFVYKTHRVETTVEDSLDEDNNSFIIPLNHFIMDQLSPKDRQAVYQQSLHLIFNSYDKQKVKWYQQSVFKVILTVIAVVIFIYTGMNFYSNLLIALEGGAAAAAYFVIKQLVYALIFSYAFKLLVRVIGAEAAFWIALVTTAYTLGRGLKTGSLKGVPFADELLMTANGLLGGIQSNLQEEMEELMSDSEEFWEQAEEQTEALETAQELLETSDLIDPYTFINPVPYFNPDETPDMYYQRTIHSGNVGILGLDAIHQYVDTMLTLPTTRESIEGLYL